MVKVSRPKFTFRNVTTRVTVKLAHSVVRINTAEIQMY